MIYIYISIYTNHMYTNPYIERAVWNMCNNNMTYSILCRGFSQTAKEALEFAASVIRCNLQSNWGLEISEFAFHQHEAMKRWLKIFKKSKVDDDWCMYLYIYIRSWKLTYPVASHVWVDVFPLPKVGYVSSLEGNLISVDFTWNLKRCSCLHGMTLLQVEFCTSFRPC